MKKMIVGAGALIVVLSTIALWNLNHGFIAFINAFISGMILAVGVSLLFEKEGDHSTKAVVFAVVAAMISIVFLANNSEDPVAKREAEKAAIVAKEKARLDAMTPAEREAEIKQKDFEAARTVYGILLVKTIKESAYDPDALKIDGPKYYKNGVCVKANGKNRFGGYVGWQEHCFLNDTGKWVYSGPN